MKSALSIGDERFAVDREKDRTGRQRRAVRLVHYGEDEPAQFIDRRSKSRGPAQKRTTAPQPMNCDFNVILNIEEKVHDQYRVNDPFDDLLNGVEVEPRQD